MLGEIVVYHPLAVPLIMLVCGLLLAFHGRKLIPLALVLAAMVLGFMHGGVVISRFTDDPQIIQWGPVAIGILLALLAVFLYRLAFFVAGILLGLFLAGILLPGGGLLWTLLIALVTGALVYLARNFVFSVLTAILGGALTASGAVNLLAWTGLSASVVVYWLILGLTTLFGLISQLKRGRK